MYLWVLIATFMVALLSYNLSVRPDADRSYMETRAQTVVAKFKAQHNAFRLYIESLKVKEEDLDTGAGVAYTSFDGYQNGHLTQDNDNLSVEKFKEFLPFGYQSQAGIYSKVYCFSDTTGNTTCEDMDITCCASASTKVYVVSWQQLPSKWVNKSDENNVRPTSDMMRIISKSDGYGDKFGFVTYKDGGPVVSGGIGEIEQPDPDDPGTYVSKMMYQPVFGAVTEDDDYISQCGEGEDDKKACLIAIDKVSNRAERTSSHVNNEDNEEENND